mmetsp:Transcript_6318/g.25406  ORF Transcript_6318/g.25406 Transcript_6318/m.25406 type:complete len:453 (+) Transcript_6318:225-1583(+)
MRIGRMVEPANRMTVGTSPTRHRFSMSSALSSMAWLTTDRTALRICGLGTSSISMMGMTPRCVIRWRLVDGYSLKKATSFWHALKTTPSRLSGRSSASCWLISCAFLPCGSALSEPRARSWLSYSTSSSPMIAANGSASASAALLAASCTAAAAALSSRLCFASLARSWSPSVTPGALATAHGCPSKREGRSSLSTSASCCSRPACGANCSVRSCRPASSRGTSSGLNLCSVRMASRRASRRVGSYGPPPATSAGAADCAAAAPPAPTESASRPCPAACALSSDAPSGGALFLPFADADSRPLATPLLPGGAPAPPVPPSAPPLAAPCSHRDEARERAPASCTRGVVTGGDWDSGEPASSCCADSPLALALLFPAEGMRDECSRCCLPFFFALRIHGWFKSVRASGRSVASLRKHWCKKSSQPGEQLSGSFGRSSWTMRKSAGIGWRSKYGG